MSGRTNGTVTGADYQNYAGILIQLLRSLSVMDTNHSKGSANNSLPDIEMLEPDEAYTQQFVTQKIIKVQRE
jgi:hypothetical protein